MNAQEAKAYLSEKLPTYTINVIENYKGKPNNRYVFTKDGVDAAMLFARSLSMTKEILQDVVDAVNKRFSTPKDTKTIEKAAEQQKDSIGEPHPLQREGAQPTELESNFYAAAKKVIKDFESKYPMT